MYSYFGQNRIAIAGYTTLQYTISTVLSNKRNRIEIVLNESLSSGTRKTLLKLLESNNTFTDYLASINLAGSASIILAG